MSQNTVHLGQKEALQIMRPYRVGETTLRRWKKTMPGLYVILPGRTRGLIVRHRLLQLLTDYSQAQPK